MVAIIPSLLKTWHREKEMIKLLIIALTGAALILSLSGCGYKAPPVYEKPISDKGSTVAL